MNQKFCVDVIRVDDRNKKKNPCQDQNKLLQYEFDYLKVLFLLLFFIFYFPICYKTTCESLFKERKIEKIEESIAMLFHKTNVIRFQDNRRQRVKKKLTKKQAFIIVVNILIKHFQYKK